VYGFVWGPAKIENLRFREVKGDMHTARCGEVIHLGSSGTFPNDRGARYMASRENAIIPLESMEGTRRRKLGSFAKAPIP
jgi:hypothetical protein